MREGAHRDEELGPPPLTIWRDLGNWYETLWSDYWPKMVEGFDMQNSKYTMEMIMSVYNDYQHTLYKRDPIVPVISAAMKENQKIPMRHWAKVDHAAIWVWIMLLGCMPWFLTILVGAVYWFHAVPLTHPMYWVCLFKVFWRIYTMLKVAFRPCPKLETYHARAKQTGMAGIVFVMVLALLACVGLQIGWLTVDWLIGYAIVAVVVIFLFAFPSMVEKSATSSVLLSIGMLVTVYVVMKYQHLLDPTYVTYKSQHPTADVSKYLPIIQQKIDEQFYREIVMNIGNVPLNRAVAGLPRINIMWGENLKEPGGKLLSFVSTVLLGSAALLLANVSDMVVSMAAKETVDLRLEKSLDYRRWFTIPEFALIGWPFALVLFEMWYYWIQDFGTVVGVITACSSIAAMMSLAEVVGRTLLRPMAVRMAEANATTSAGVTKGYSVGMADISLSTEKTLRSVFAVIVMAFMIVRFSRVYMEGNPFFILVMTLLAATAGYMTLTNPRANQANITWLMVAASGSYGALAIIAALRKLLRLQFPTFMVNKTGPLSGGLTVIENV